MAFPLARPSFTWQLRTRALVLGGRTRLMGILNITPDSFSDGGQFHPRLAAIRQGLRLLDEGADILDLGGESTRPNAAPVSATDEQARVLPIITAILKARPEAVLSIDTYHASTARLAIEAGAEIVNDVSGLLWDPDMAFTVAALNCGVILTHTRGSPRQWSSQTPLPPADILPNVLEGLRQQSLAAHNAGISECNIVLDPGFGFGKRYGENFTLHAGLPQLHQMKFPLLVGTSRKGFLGAAVKPGANGFYPHADTASNVAAILAGAHILRVHEILPATEAAAIADAILQASGVLS